MLAYTESGGIVVRHGEDNILVAACFHVVVVDTDLLSYSIIIWIVRRSKRFILQFSSHTDGLAQI